MRILAILENMWNPQWAGRIAPLTFSINPGNYTGKKLYRITQGHALSVTNAYCLVGCNARHKVGPSAQDRDRLQQALDSREWDGVLVCGRPAQKALEALPGPFPFFRVYMPHPAARNLTNLLLAGVSAHLNNPPCADVEFVQQPDGFVVRSLSKAAPAGILPSA